MQQVTCKIDLSNFFYYLFFSFVLLELKPFVLKGKVRGEKLWKSVKSVKNYETILPFSFCPLVFPWAKEDSKMTNIKRPRRGRHQSWREQVVTKTWEKGERKVENKKQWLRTTPKRAVIQRKQPASKTGQGQISKMSEANVGKWPKLEQCDARDLMRDYLFGKSHKQGAKVRTGTKRLCGQTNPNLDSTRVLNSPEAAENSWWDAKHVLQTKPRQKIIPLPAPQNKTNIWAMNALKTKQKWIETVENRATAKKRKKNNQTMRT